MRRIVIVFAILLVFLLIGSVNANDTFLEDNSTLSEDVSLNDTLDNSSHSHVAVSSVLSDSPVKKSVISAPGGTFVDFQNLIGIASAGDTIELSGDYVYDGSVDSSLIGGIQLSKSLTIVGNGHSFSGSKQARIFNIMASNVYISDVVFTQGYAVTVLGGSYRGGAIFNSGTNVHIDNCTFVDNYGYIAPAIEQWQGSMYIDYCFFINNTITDNGDHTVCADRVLYITHSVFEGNNGAGASTLLIGGGGYARYNVFLSSTSSQPVGVGGGSTIDDNWWGTNTPNIGALVQLRSGSSYPTRWIVMNFTNLGNVSSSGGNVEFLSTLNQIYSSSDGLYYDVPDYMAPRNVIYTTTGGSLNSSNSNIIWNDTVNLNYPSGLSDLTVNAQIDNQVLTVGTSNIELDLNIVKTPQIAGTFIYCLSLHNYGSFDARDVEVNFTLPSDLIYMTSTDTSNYDNNTGIWRIGTLTSGSTYYLNVTMKVPYLESYIGKNYTSSASVTGTFLDFNTVNNNPSVNFTIQNISSGSYILLQELIDDTPSGGELNLTFDVTYDPILDVSLQAGMIVNKPITINGNGHTISGLTQARIFIVSGTNIHFNNIVFTQGYTITVLGGLYRGGAIFSTGSNVNITNCTFFNNTGYVGAAVEQYGGYMYIDSCYFINNTLTSGGAHTVCADATLYITRSIFEGNVGDSVKDLLIGGGGYAKYNAFLTPSGTTPVGVGGGSSIDDNWWGTNTPNIGALVQVRSGSGYPSHWVVMNFTNLQKVSTSGGNVELLTTLNTIYDSSSNSYSIFNDSMALRPVKYQTTSGTFNSSSSTIDWNDTVTLNYPSGLSNLLVNATIDNQVMTIGTADIEVNITVSNDKPQLIDSIVYTITVHNYGSFDARDVNVYFTYPSNFTYKNSTSTNYNSSTGKWFIGNISSGTTQTLNITVQIPFDYSLVNKTFNTNATITGTYFDFNLNDNNNATVTVQNRTGGSYTLLQYLIDNTPSGGVLNMSFNVTYDNVSDVWLQTGMKLDKPITINGNGFTIDGLNQSRVFYVTGSDVKINNMTITHGKAVSYEIDGYRGGGIYSVGPNFNISNCTFAYNFAPGPGSAIEQRYNTIYIEDTIFVYNHADAHVICIDSTGYVKRCLFENNTAIEQSVCYVGTGGITDSVIVNNSGNYLRRTGSNYFENNWWGTNTPDFGYLIIGAAPVTWVVMNFTNTTPITSTAGSSTLLVSLNTLYDSSTNTYTTFNSTLPYRTVYFNWTTGSVTPNITNIQNTTTNTFNYPASMPTFQVNATIDNQTLFIGSADLEILIIPNKNPVDDGDNISFIIMVINHGYVNTTNVNVTITIPPGLINVTATTDNGTFNNTTMVWTIGDINASSNKTLILNGTLNNPGYYLLLNATINNTDAYDGITDNNNYTCNVTVIQWSDLEITKNISDLHPDTKDNVTYIITVYNHGPSTARNVTVFDNLSTKLIYQTSNATSGYYNETTCIWFIDNITPGGNETINITVFINQSGITDNFVNVTSLCNDSNWTNNYANISFETAPLSDLWVTITMDPQTSNYITYHIQAGNNGIEPANGTVVVFNLSNLYIYSNHTEDKGIYNNDTGVWDIGYLDVGEIVNLTLIVRLDFPMGTTFANITTSVNITSWSTDLYPENNTDNISFEAEIFGNFRLLQDIVDSWSENTTQILPRSFAYDPVQDAPLPGETYNLINGVRLYKNITIVNPYGFTIGGFNLARIFNISADNIVLDGLKFYDGYSPLGAALNIHANNVQVLRSNFTNNWLYGDYGGAIFTNGANTIIRDNIFTQNSATKLGGAIGAVGANNIQIINNTFINNSVESDEVFGGAIGLTSSTGIVNGNVFLDNIATASSGLGSAIFTNNSNINLEANWFGNNTPDMITEELIWGNKPETYIILDWEIVNPNMTGVTLNAVFFLYNTTTGNKTRLNYGIPYRTLTVTARDPTLSWYNTTYTGNNTFNYTYNPSIPIYQVNATVDYQTITLEWSTFLSVNKTLLNDTIWFGDNLIYNITIINYGPHKSNNITITDLLPEDLTINNLTHTIGNTSITPNNINWTLIINPGVNETLIINTTPLKEKLYTNNLTVNSTSPYDYFLWGNMSVTGEVLPLIDLSINFTISAPPYYVGEDINYTITIHNNGPSNATNVTVHIPIPPGLTFLYAWNLEGYIPDYNSITGVWNVGTLHTNETIQINITSRLNSAGEYNQTVNITGYGVELNKTDNNQTISFNVSTQVDLELNMTISTNETLYGNLISITYSLLNKGPSPATNTTVFTIFSGLTYGSSTGYGSFNNITPFTGYWYVGNLNNGSLVTRTLYFYANNLGDFTITGRANCSDNESYWPNNYANVTLKVIKYADLSITKTVSNATPFLEQVITYTITVTNLAGFTAENVTVYDPLPSVLAYNNSNPNYNGTHWFVGNLTVGESKNLTFNVTVDGIGIIWNNATVNSSLNDSNHDNNHAEVSISVPVGDDLRMYINVIPATPSSNAAFIINLSVWNRGFVDNQNVTVEFHIPAGLIYLNSTNMGAYNPGTGFWDIGFLANGSWTNLEIWVYPDTIGDVTLEANVSGQVVDIAPDNNRANLTFEIVPSFDLAVTKTANTTNVDDGDLIGFDITVWNKGPYTANNVKITDYLPNGLLYYINNASGVYDNNTRTVNWTIPTLNMGEVFTFHLTCRVWNPGISFTNTVTASAYGTDSNITDNTASVTVNVTPNNDLEVRINASKTTDIDLGENIVFYITVLNHGPSNATNVIAQFLVPSIFTYLSDNGGGYYLPSTGEWLIGNLGSKENITLAVNVNLTSLGMCKANTTVNSTYTDKNLSNNYDEINITATPIFDLNITAYWNLTNNTLIWNELANLTIIVSNKGPENATNVTVTINVPNVSYINDTSLGKLNTTTWTWNVGNLNVGEYKNITITFKGETCGFSQATGNITGHGYDNNTTDNNFTLNLTILPVVDLVMTNLTVNTTYAGLDDILEFNVTVYNKGPCNATNVTIVGFLPVNWTIYAGNLVADIPVNSSHTFNIFVSANTWGNFTVGFNATINGVDTYPLDNNKTIGPIEIIYDADLMITIKVNNDYLITGDIVVYVITVSNLDWHTAHNVTANITIPNNLSLNHYYLASGTYNPSNGTWNIGNLSFRNSTTLFLFCNVNTPGRTDFWVNVSGDDFDFNLENNNDTINISATMGLNLNITLLADNNTPYTGDNLTFTVIVENIGLINATGVSVDINIPVGFINPRSTDLNFTGNSWYIGNLSIGDSKSFNFTVTPCTTNASLFNVSVSASRVDFNSSGNFASLIVSPTSASDLQVKITCNNTTPRIWENVTYTITIHNNGLIDVNNVIIFNNLPFSLAYSTSTPIYSPISKMWSISNLPAGATETLNITINHTLSGEYTYNVNITGNTIDTNTSNNKDNITIQVTEPNDLKVEFTTTNNNITDGNQLNFTITVINDGIYNNTNVKVYTNLPNTITYNSTDVFDTNLGIWDIGNLTVGENKTITLTINLTNIGNYTYWANATGDQNDKNYSNNNQSINITVYADYDLKVNITTINTTININDTSSLIITVTNYGPSTAYNITVLNDIPGNLTGISKGTYTGNTWNISNLTSGETQTLNIALKPSNNGTYTYNIEVIADNFQYDRNNTDNKDNITINVTNIVDLIINITTNKTVVNKTETVEFTVTVANNGNITANNVLIQTENLFNNIISITPSTGFVSSNSWLIFSLAPNTTETLKITRYITNDTIVKVNVSSDNQEKDNTTNYANTTIYTVKETDLTINIAANTSNLYLGDNVTFIVTVSNIGNETAENVTVHLDLPYSVSYDNVYMYDSQQGVWLIGQLENNTCISFNITATINTLGIITYNATINTTTFDINLLNNHDNVTINITSILDLEIDLRLNTTDTIYSTDSFNVFVGVTNFGPSNATGVIVKLNIPGTTFITNNGTYFAGLWNIGNLPMGETANLNITCNLTSSNNGIYYANVTSNEKDKSTGNNNASINLTIVDISDLEVRITSSINETDIHNSLTYTVTVTNHGPDIVNDAIVRINLPDAFNVTFNMSSNGIFNGTHWILGTLGTGFSGIANLYITGYYDAYGNQTAMVLVNSSNLDSNGTNNVGDMSVWITPVCDLLVNFTSTGYYNPDGTVTFNITVTNSGPCNATDIKLYTNLNPTNSYNESTGYFDTLQNIWYISNLNVGEIETLIINTTYISGIQHYANITSSTKESNNSNNVKFLNFTLTPLADLSMAIVVNNSNPLFGESVTFTIMATNLGLYNATGVIVSVDLPASSVYAASKGLFSTVTGNWSIGNLSVGETASLNITLNITNEVLAHANITGKINDTNTSNNNATINISLKKIADLSIKLTLNQSSFIIGDNITVFVNVTNIGPNIAENLTINTILPGGFVPDSVYAWNLTSLTNNTSIMFNITGILTTDGIKTVEANITSLTYDNNTSNNYDSLNFNVENTVDLLIEITSNLSSIFAGEYVIILVNVTNLGNGTAENIIVFTNIFNATGDKNGYYDKDTGYWYIGNLTSNQTVNLNLTVQIIENTTYTVSVNTTNIDTNTTNNNDTLNITVTPTTNLNITVNTNSKVLYLEDELTYTITVTNNGYNTAENVTVNMNNTVFNFTYSNDTNFNNLTNIWNIGNIYPGETRTLILKYLINTTGNITTQFNTTTITNETNLTDNYLNVTVEILNTTKPINNLVDLIINITTDNPTPSINSTVKFNITVFNNATNTATNLTIHNFLPIGLTPTGTYTGEWNIINLPAYSNISFTFTANITNYGSFVTNTSVNSIEWDSNPTNNRANTLITCNAPTGDYTDLQINITRTGNITIDGLIKYIINVTNNGSTLATNVNATISIFEGLNYTSDNGSGTYNFTNSLWNIGNLNPGTSSLLEITLNITKAGYYNNVFIVYANQMDSKPQNNLILDNFQVNDTRVDINIRITANKTYVTNNETILFTVTVTNPSLNTATDVNVTLDIPNEFTIISFSGYNNGSYYIGTLNSMQNYNFTFTATLNSTNSSTITVNATLNETDNQYNDNTDTITITPWNNNLNGIADLHINITVNEQYPEIETVPIFNMWVTNYGPDDATNIEVPIYIPADCISTSADTYWDNSTSTFRLANLSVGATIKFEVSFRISTTNPILFNASAKSDQFDPNITDNKASISLYPWEATPTCDLNITIVPIGNEFYANDRVKFNVTIRNFGEKTAFNVSVRNIVPPGLTLESISTTWAYTPTSDGWLMPNHTINTNKSFILTYRIDNKGLYQTTMEVNTSTLDVDPTSNGMGVAIYAGEAEPDRRNVTTKTTGTVTVATLNGNANWTFKGTLKMANSTPAPTQNFPGQKLYANITSDAGFELVVESIDVTGSNGVANFAVNSGQLMTGAHNYKVTIFYKGEKTDDTYYLPSVATSITRRVTVNP